jgi:molybdate transport system substrate-binding protein
MASQTIKAFTAGATREGLNLCAIPFTAQTGIPIEAHTNHGHMIEQEVMAGNVDDDIVLLPSAMIDELAKNKLVDSSTRTAIGTIRIGAAVREGVPTPDVLTLTSVTQTLFSAKSIVLTEAPSGVHMDRVITELGLGHKLADRITRYDTGTMVNEHLSTSRAKAEIAFGVATEILFFRDRGVCYAGPLPDEMQMALDYEAVMLKSCQKPDAVEMLFTFLKTQGSQNLFAQTGVG